MFCLDSTLKGLCGPGKETMTIPRVLVVDDSRTIRAQLTELLRSKCAVTCADGVREMETNLADNDLPDLIILDIQMPEMDGPDVCRMLKSRAAVKHIPVIFNTAFVLTEDEVVRLLELGAVDVISKGSKREILLAKVGTHLKLIRARKALQFRNGLLNDEVKRRTKELELEREETIRRLVCAAESRDDDTGHHIERVSRYSFLLAQQRGLAQRDCEMILQASLLHDVGKISVSDDILHKPGRLTDEEREIMKSHTTFGAKILKGSSSLLLQVAEIIALCHHERWDGTGYPRGLSGVRIPEYARIVAVADVFDALSSDRPYKKAWPEAEAIAEIVKSGGTHFDPDMVVCFQRALPEILAAKEKLSKKEEG